MRLENVSKRCYQHSVLDEKKRVVILNLMPGENKEIPDEVAKQWLKGGEVRIYVSPEEAKAKEEELKEENLKLKRELALAKARATKAKKNGKSK